MSSTLRQPPSRRDFEDVSKAVRSRLVGAEEQEVRPGCVRSRRARTRRAPASTRPLDARASPPRPRTSRKSGSSRSRSSDPPLACGFALIRRSPSGASRGSSRAEPPAVVEELLRAIAPQPLFQQTQVLRVRPHVGHRHLMRAPGPFHLQAVDLAPDPSSPSATGARSSATSACWSLHRPARSAGSPRFARAPRRERRRTARVHRRGRPPQRWR